MALEHESDSALARAVREARSQSAFGRLVGKRQSTVREWLKAGQVPAEQVVAVEEALTRAGIAASRYDLRPDLYARDPAPAAADVAGLEVAR